MDFIFSVINFIGFILYLCAVLAFIRFICTVGQKNVLKLNFDIIALSILIGSLVSGFFIRDYAQNQKKLIRINEIIDKQGNNPFAHYNLESILKDLNSNDKDKYVQVIFTKLYNDSLVSRAKFIDDYSDINTTFIMGIRSQTQEEITQLYKKHESTNTWNDFVSQLPIKIFFKVASNEIVNKEYSKWKTDEEAWQRVLTLDSVFLSNEYLSRYNHGIHEIDAKRIILNHEHEDKTRIHLPKVTNFTGSSTFNITNSSSYKISFSYHGAFKEGHETIPGHTTKVIVVPNGYYRISLSSEKLHTKGINEVVTCNNSYIPYDLSLVQGR